MSRRYTYATSLSWGGDEPTAEMEVEVSFGVDWGRPETPPAYSHGGLPADPTEVIDITVETIDGRPVAEATALEYMPGATVEAITDKLEADHLDQMIEAALEREAA